MSDDEEDEGERTESEDMSIFHIIPKQPTQNIDKVCDNIINLAGILGFKHVKYDSLERIDKDKVEQVVLNMMIKFKYTLVELGKEIPEELYSKMDKKWKWVLFTKR